MFAHTINREEESTREDESTWARVAIREHPIGLSPVVPEAIKCGTNAIRPARRRAGRIGTLGERAREQLAHVRMESQEMADRLPTVLLLGTGHWGNPGLDFKSTDFDDMLAPKRQQEIAQCLDQLARFAPTEVALEILPGMAEAWNAEYQAYRDGTFALTANERHQLGFRLAAMADLDRIHGIDWHDFERPIGWERAIDFAREHGQDHNIGFYTTVAEETEADQAAEREHIRRTSVREQLLGTNTPEAMAESHQVYMGLAQVGEGNNYIGAEVVLRWYERNMMMFVNISRLATHLESRVLVVVGGGHLPLLRHYLTSSGRFHVDEVGTYLS